jgi:ABC-type transport system substrate-binding protein
MYIDFEQGALDAACAIATTDAERVLAGDAPSFTGYYVNSIRDILMIILPEETAIFDDIRVREAFFKSVDRENVAVAMFGPLFLEADSILPSSINFYQSQEVPDYDPDGAKELLAEAGYPDGISLRLIVTQDMQVLAEALQASLATGGINCSVESYDIGTAIPMLRDMESDFICKQAEGGAFINEPCLLLDTLSPESTLPPAGMTDETWSQYFYESIYSTSDEDRAEGYAGLQKWAAEEYRCLPVCERANMTVYNTDKLESFVLACADEPCAMYAKFK